MAALNHEKPRHLTLQHLPYDAPENEPFTPSLPFHRRTPRRMRRFLLRVLNRKTVIAAIVFMTIAFALFHGSQRFPSNPWSSSSVFSCPSNRTNPNNIVPPNPADQQTFSQLWKDLLILYEAHPPSPPHIDHPRHKSDLGFPSKEKMGSFFALTDQEAKASRDGHKAVMDKLPPYPGDQFSGRGVVMLAGGRYSEFAATSLGMLREVGSELPVEVWIKDETEDVPGWCEELEQEGMACRRLSDYMDMTALKHPYSWKVFTMLFSSFQEMLLLDADDAPIKNPDVIFDSEVYQKHGAILWPDYWKHSGSPWLPYIIGITEGQSEKLYDEQSVESGQIIWDKERHWKSLVLATFYNYYGPDFYYTVFNNGWAGWGDKDTFPMALKATGESYHQISPKIVTTFVTGTLLGIGMIQASPLNLTYHDPMFLHSNIVKWSMRDFSCIKCDDLPNHHPHYHLEDDTSPVHTHLKEGKRIFAMAQMDDKHIDPEPIMWKTIEYAACRSAAWGNEQVCKQTRTYMEKVFGFKFRKSRFASAVGNGDQYCLVDPGME